MTQYERDNIDPPRTEAEKKRRDSTRYRDVKYGFYPVVTEKITHPKCDLCHEEVVGIGMKIDEKYYHNQCWVSLR
jgi:hypothetical protein